MQRNDRLRAGFHYLLMIAIGLSWALGSGCGSTPTTRSRTFGMGTSAGSETLLRIGDQLTVRCEFGGVQQPQVNDVVVDENGEISLPLMGRVKAEGLTTSELAERIQASYVP